MDTTTAHTQPAPLDGPLASDLSQFRVDSMGEIVGLLRQLRDAATPIAITSPNGASLVTELWTVDAEQRRVNFTADDNNPSLRAIVHADEAVGVGYLDSVKLQFDLHDLLVVRGMRSCALQATLPPVLYRFQRRSAYRVRTPERHAPSARLRHPSLPDMRLALRLIDVSTGGCALALPADVPVIPPGVVLHQVVVELDADTRFTAAISVQHVSSMQGSEHGVRMGCEWRDIEPGSLRALQRYIDQTQKRRRLLSLD